ncbi:MAG: hypothetical protein JWO38_440 [Gemmataceae bacterium]|nr:hypothetical protein [Gemmataceae bacterium]
MVKAHAICVVKTNIVTSVEIGGRDAGDSPQFTHDGKAWVVPSQTGSGKYRVVLWDDQKFFYYNFRRDEFLKRYPRRRMPREGMFTITARRCPMRIKREWLTAGLLISSPFLFCCGWQQLFESSKSRFVRLMEGDKSIHLRSVTIHGQGLHLPLDDPETLAYLESALLSAEKEGYVPRHHGHSHQANVDLGWPYSLTIGFAADEEGQRGDDWVYLYSGST